MRILTLILLILLPNSNHLKAYPIEENDIFKNLKYRNVGPTRGGRVTTVHGVDSQRNTFYMGTTGGGLWKTTDSGNNWFNVSDGYFNRCYKCLPKGPKNSLCRYRIRRYKV